MSGYLSGRTSLTTVQTGDIAADAVTTAKIAPDAVTAAEIGDNVLDSEHYAATSIDNEHLADDAVNAAEIGALTAALDINGQELILDADADTSITSDTDDQIDVKIAGADDFRFTANNFNVLSGSTLTIDSGATITNSGTATNFGVDPESAYAGVLQTNANFVDHVIFGPAVDGRAWNGLWNKASVFSSLMLATIEDEGSNTEINIWDLTQQSAGAISTTPLATIDLTNAATPTDIAACMGYLIVSSEDGIHIIDPHDGTWAERTKGWPKSLGTGGSGRWTLSATDVNGVAAGLSDQPRFDPLTGGPMPTFAISYGSGSDCASIIKNDGTVWHRAGTPGNPGAGIWNGHVFYANDTGNDAIYGSPKIDTIEADDWTNYALMRNDSTGLSLGSDAGFDLKDGGLVASADTSGLTFALPSHFMSGEKFYSINAMVNRTYNTGYFHDLTKGLFLANSSTADRMTTYNNTLTVYDGNAITEGAVESGAELNGYSGWSSTVWLYRANDADFAPTTGDFSVAGWFKCTGGGPQCFFRYGVSDTNTNSWMVQMNSDESIRFMLRDSAGTNVEIDAGASAGRNYEDSTWHMFAGSVDRTDDIMYWYIDGQLEGTASTSSTASMTNTTQKLEIGIRDTSTTPTTPATGSTFALFRYAQGTNAYLTGQQVRHMYDAEKEMFKANAECLLQSSSTDAVLDVGIDPLSDKVIVTQTDAITIFDGLVVDSKPTVNSGSSEKGSLWGDLRVEQNSANTYVTAPAVDQRQVNELVRGLANELPPGMDVTKAKAWLFYDNSTHIIHSSYNIKSVTDVGTAMFKCFFAIPFKSKFYAAGGLCIAGGGGNFVTGNDSLANMTRDKFYAYIDGGDSAAAGDFPATIVFFGELENE